MISTKIVKRYGSTLEQAPPDEGTAAWVTKHPLEQASARRLCAELREAPDRDDPTRAWVYVGTR